MRLHKKIIYYVYIFSPMLILMSISMAHLMDSVTFTVSIFSYGFIYHPWISGKRLVALGVIPPSKLICNFIPFWNKRYFDYLFLGTSVSKEV